jgi:hypothetical protein
MHTIKLVQNLYSRLRVRNGNLPVNYKVGDLQKLKVVTVCNLCGGFNGHRHIDRGPNLSVFEPGELLTPEIGSPEPIDLSRLENGDPEKIIGRNAPVRSCV